jgi:uncharacterized protein (DUF2235 family)
MKRLVVCCDGTWQTLDNLYPTNVLKLAQAVQLEDPSGVPQVVYYDEGVGTGGWVDNLAGGAFGAGIDRKIEAAYRFLCLNYAPGDEVYLFGFSRGAYTVRSLAGLIYNSGLLRREFVRKVSEAYELYRSRSEVHRPGGEVAVEFRRKYGDRIEITALGCWDTVGSLGVPEMFPPLTDLINRRYRFYDTRINPCIGRAFHAVAVDEIREPFGVTPMQPSLEREAGQVLQVWFPGEHGCVGGGARETRGLSDGALAWMMDQVEALGLSLDRSRVEDGILPNPQIPFDNRPKGVFRMLGSRPREVMGCFDDLHRSVKLRWKAVEAYKPPNLEPFEADLEGWGPD